MILPRFDQRIRLPRTAPTTPARLAPPPPRKPRRWLSVAAIVARSLSAEAKTAEYELVLLLDPQLADERRDEIAGGARGRIEGGGELKQEAVWGNRKLSYEIGGREEADYRFFRFGAPSPVLDDLDHTLKITDGVLRFRLFKVDPRSPVIEPPPPAPLGQREGGRREGRRDGRGRGGDRGPRRDESRQRS